MKIEISSETLNALANEYEKYMDLYDEVTADYPNEEQQAFIALFETVGMVLADMVFETVGMVLADEVNEELDDWCEQNRSVMEAALRESQPLKEIV